MDGEGCVDLENGGVMSGDVKYRVDGMGGVNFDERDCLGVEMSGEGLDVFDFVFVG